MACQVVDADDPQCALQQFLEQRIGGGLIERTAFGLQDLPVFLPQRCFELVNDTGLSDAGRSHQREDLAGLPDLQRGLLQERGFLCAPYEGRKALDRACPPTGQPTEVDKFVARDRSRESLELLWRQDPEVHKPRAQALAGLGDDDLSGPRRPFQPLHQVNGRPARLVDRGQIGFDHVGHDIARVDADPHMEAGVIQLSDAANEFGRCLARHDGMIVVGVRSPEQRNQAISALLADDTAVTAHRTAHGIERRLQAGDCRFRIEFRDQVGRALQVDTEDSQVLSFACYTVARVGGHRLGRMIGNRRPAGRAKQVTDPQG